MEGSYSGAWRRYRVWSWAFWLAFLLYLPGMAFLSRALGWTRDGGDPIFVGALVWMVLVAVIGYRKWNFRCPRCGELYFRAFRRAPLAPGLAAQPLCPPLPALRPAEVGGGGMSGDQAGFAPRRMA